VSENNNCRKINQVTKTSSLDIKVKVNYIGTFKCELNDKTEPIKSKDYEFILITSGKGYCNFNGIEQVINEGIVIFIKPNESHFEYAADKQILKGILFSIKESDELNELINASELVTFLNTEENFRTYQSLFTLLLNESQSKDVRYSYQILNSISKTILYKLLHVSPIFNLPTKTNDTFSTVKTYIDNYFNQDITLEEICKKLYTNKYYISRLFREFIGITPAHYIIEKRIQYAKILLENPDKTIESIANSVGYTDYYHFSRLFKKEVGISPKQYRKHLLNDIKETIISTNINMEKQKVGDIADFGGWNEQMVVKQTADKDGITWIGSQDESKYNQAWFFANKVTKDQKLAVLKNYTYSCYVKPLASDTSSEGKVQLYIGTATHKYCIALYTKNGFVQIWDNITGGWVSEAAKVTFNVDEANLVEIKHRLIEEGKAELTILVNKKQIIQMEIAEAIGDFGMDIFSGTNIYFGNPTITTLD